jgi:hypothetical protein
VADSANKSHPHMYTSKEANLVTKFRGFFFEEIDPIPIEFMQNKSKRDTEHIPFIIPHIFKSQTQKHVVEHW